MMQDNGTKKVSIRRVLVLLGGILAIPVGVVAAGIIYGLITVGSVARGMQSYCDRIQAGDPVDSLLNDLDPDDPVLIAVAPNEAAFNPDSRIKVAKKDRVVHLGRPIGRNAISAILQSGVVDVARVATPFPYHAHCRVHFSSGKITRKEFWARG